MSVESCLWNHIKDLTKEEVLAAMEKHKIEPESFFLSVLRAQLHTKLMERVNAK